MRILAIAWLLAATGSAAELALSLPAWAEAPAKQVERENWLPGGELLLAGEEEPGYLGDTGVDPPSASEMTRDEPANEIPDSYLDPYFAERPDTFLVDPQGLLDPTSRRDREAFLDYHSSDSRIDFHVYIFGPEQQIPGEIRDEEMSERVFSEGKPSLVLFYYFGAPQRSEILLSPSLTDAVSDAERRRIISSSILSAAEKSDPVAQLEAFCVQTSIRIYWMEKAAGLVEEASPPPVARPHPRSAPAEPSRVELMRTMFDGFWWDWGALLSASSAGLLITLGCLWLSRRRAKYRLPEFEVEPRLGGSHAAGIGAVIGFGSTTQSPSSQHSGVPDYFGGI